MTAPPPLRVTVYDKDMNYRGTIGNPISVRCVVRHNAKSVSTITVPADHQRVPDLMEEGSRIVIDQLYGQDGDDGFVTSGAVETLNGEGPISANRLSLTVHDDFVHFEDVLGWVEPTLDIESQGINGKEHDIRGPAPAETVVKAYAQANMVDRLGLPVVIAPDQGRGLPVTGKIRMLPLYEKLFPVVDGAGVDISGIGITARQKDVGGGVQRIVIDAYETQVIPQVLTEQSGVVTGWRWSRARPTATRVVVAGQEIGADRSFRMIADTEREVLFGTKRERVRDARDEEDASRLYLRGQETLDDGSEKSGLSVTLSNTTTFRLGSLVRVGDVATMAVGRGIVVGPDVLKEATLLWNREGGFKATPTVGEVVDSPARKMARTIHDVATSLRRSNLERY